MAGCFTWIKAEPMGIRVVPADAWIDPSRAVARALVTHGHADHARAGMGGLFATPATLAIMGVRYGVADGAVQACYHAPVALGRRRSATFLPAGHVLGSAQILLSCAGER